MNRVDRLIAMLWLLRSRRSLTARELGEIFGISERSVYRDIAALAAAGVPVVSLPGPGGGYTLPDGFALTPLAVTDQEAAALLLGSKLAARLASPFRAAADTAIAKIQRALPELQNRRVSQWLAVLDPLLEQRTLPEDYPEAFRQLVEAAAAGEQVELTYDSDQCTVRTVEPYRLRFERGAWYLEAYCLLRRAVRHFRLDRIRALRLTGVRFDPERARSQAPAAAETVAVLLALPPEHAAWYRAHPLFGRWVASEAEPPATAAAPDVGPAPQAGRSTLRLAVPRTGIASLTAALLGAGGEEQVLAPDWLREQVLQAARGVLAAHAAARGEDVAPA